MQPYIHQVCGRIRVRSVAIKQSAKEVEQLVAQLKNAEGIQSVEYKRYAGSVAVRYDVDLVTADSLLALFDSRGLLRDDLADDIASRVISNGCKLVGRTLISAAAYRLLGPKASSVLNSL